MSGQLGYGQAQLREAGAGYHGTARGELDQLVHASDGSRKERGAYLEVEFEGTAGRLRSGPAQRAGRPCHSIQPWPCPQVPFGQPQQVFKDNLLLGAA